LTQLRRRENARRSLTAEEACRIGEQIGIDWGAEPFDSSRLPAVSTRSWSTVCANRRPNVTDDDPVVTAKSALAHLNEPADYYTRLERMDDEAKRELG
jgi:Protein of unknown function (DUF5661)